MISYDDESTDLAYTCTYGHAHTTNLATQNEGKLAWKVDWPMRWAFEHVDFEPAGMDDATPGSSFTVGHELVETGLRDAAAGLVRLWLRGLRRRAEDVVVRGWRAHRRRRPARAGGADPPWLYVRRNPKQTFDIDFGPEVVRLYDEWDSLARKAADPDKRDLQVLAWERASATAAGPLPAPRVVVPFRLLSSVADVTAGSAEQISRIVGEEVDDLEPRLDRAVAWTSEYVDPADRTTVRESPDAATLASLDDRQRTWLRLLLDGLSEPLQLGAVTSLVYGVPKLARGMALDDKPTDEVKADQKEFFGLLYRLLVDAERGPRLPTLVMALGTERVRSLLGVLEQLVGRRGAGVAQERRAPLPLVVLADRARGQGEQRQAAQEAAVGLVLPRHRAVALPAVAAQHVEAAVVADPGVGVDRQVVGVRRRGPCCAPGRPTRPGTPGAGVRPRPRSSPPPSSASAGSAGRWVGGGPAIRSEWVMGAA